MKFNATITTQEIGHSTQWWLWDHLNQIDFPQRDQATSSVSSFTHNSNIIDALTWRFELPRWRAQVTNRIQVDSGPQLSLISSTHPYLTFYSLTFMDVFGLTLIYYMWYLPVESSMIDLQQYVLTKVGLDSVYLADVILRLGSLPYLGYLIDSCIRCLESTTRLALV